MREVLRPLVDFNYWANHRLLQAVEGLSPEPFVREAGREFSFPSLQGMLVHIMGAELLWLGRWRGVSAAFMERAEDYPTVAVLRGRWAIVERDVRGFVDALTDADLSRVLEYRTTEGQPNRGPLWQMIQHLVNHGTHHRSEVATMLTRLGHRPPATDLIVYYRTAAGTPS
ncbi:MAG: DinB family protein [Candidatus Rokubacteria bacterium]|nr:DinB family protein [Candidatus Rokubacteria bacterium]